MLDDQQHRRLHQIWEHGVVWLWGQVVCGGPARARILTVDTCRGRRAQLGRKEREEATLGRDGERDGRCRLERERRAFGSEYRLLENDTFGFMMHLLCMTQSVK